MTTMLCLQDSSSKTNKLSSQNKDAECQILRKLPKQFSYFTGGKLTTKTSISTKNSLSFYEKRKAMLDQQNKFMIEGCRQFISDKTNEDNIRNKMRKYQENCDSLIKERGPLTPIKTPVELNYKDSSYLK